MQAVFSKLGEINKFVHILKTLLFIKTSCASHRTYAYMSFEVFILIYSERGKTQFISWRWW